MPIRCRDCGCEMPSSQPICPECYSSVTKSERRRSSAEEVRKNVMIFFRDSVYSEWFKDRVLKYVSEQVEWVWYAETSKALRDITQNSAGSWGLLIVDNYVAQRDQELLIQLVRENPGIVVAIEYDSGIDFPASAPLKSAIMFRRPSDIDPWLLIMHQLLTGLDS